MLRLQCCARRPRIACQCVKANVTAARDLSCLVFSAGLSQTTQLSVTTMIAIQTLSECDGGRSECD